MLLGWGNKVGILVKLIATNCACDRGKHVEAKAHGGAMCVCGCVCAVFLPLGVGRAKLS